MKDDVRRKLNFPSAHAIRGGRTTFSDSGDKKGVPLR